ncbi:cytoskeleton-associated protein 4 [Rhinophrynus dorsalis]
MSNARQRNKNHSAESNSQPPPANDVAKKSKHSKGSSPPKTSGVIWKVLAVLFYAGLIAAGAGIGWVVYNLLEEVSQMSISLKHISQQKGELAENVDTLQKQVDLLQKTVGRLEFISKDIQEKQLTHDASIKKSEKELDQIGVILKKLQRDLSGVIQDVKDQGDNDLIQFENTMREKFTELNNSINEDINELTEVQKSSGDEINSLKDKLASLEDFHSIKDELKVLKDLTSSLETSFKQKDESIEWLMNNAINVESVTANSNDIEFLKNAYNNLKRDEEVQVTAVEELKEKLLSIEALNVKSNIERLSKELEKFSAAFAEIDNRFISTNNDLLTDIESSRDGIEQRLKPLENIVETINSQTALQFETLESLKSSLEEYSRRLNAAEETLSGMKYLSTSDDTEKQTETLSVLKEAQQTLSKDIDELKLAISNLPNPVAEFEKLQVELTSALESHKSQVEDLKYDYDQWKIEVEGNINNIGSSHRTEQIVDVDGLNSSINKLETDLKMLRTAVDSLVEYSVKIETNEKDLESVKYSIEDLKQSTDKLMLKLEQIHEEV